MKQKDWKNVLGDLDTMPERKIKLEKTEGLEKTLDDLFGIYKGTRVYDLDWPDKIYKTYWDLLEKNNIKITPEAIETFALRLDYAGGPANGRKMGLFLTAMVQKSFQQGYNNFEILMYNNHPLHLFGMYLRGEQDKKLVIRFTNVAEKQKYIDGEPHAWFNNVAYLDATIIGMDLNIDTFGKNAGESIFKTDNEELFNKLYGLFKDNCEFYLISQEGKEQASAPEPEFMSGMQVLRGEA